MIAIVPRTMAHRSLYPNNAPACDVNTICPRSTKPPSAVMIPSVMPKSFFIFRLWHVQESCGLLQPVACAQTDLAYHQPWFLGPRASLPGSSVGFCRSQVRSSSPPFGPDAVRSPNAKLPVPNTPSDLPQMPVSFDPAAIDR